MLFFCISYVSSSRASYTAWRSWARKDERTPREASAPMTACVSGWKGEAKGEGHTTTKGFARGGVVGREPLGEGYSV